MARTLVIGYGNPIRGDDGLGWYIAQRLAQAKSPRDLDVLALHQLTPELADDLSHARLAIFMDACCDVAPGLLSCRLLKPNPPQSRVTTHHLDPRGLLSFTRDVYGTSPDAILLSVGGESFGYEERMTPRIEGAIPILERILDICIEIGNGNLLEYIAEMFDGVSVEEAHGILDKLDRLDRKKSMAG